MADISGIRFIDSNLIRNAVEELCASANYELPLCVKNGISDSIKKENNELAKKILQIIEENYKIAESDKIAICQDTGFVTVFLKVGQDVHISGDLKSAINQGVRNSYNDNYFRQSVAHPLTRENTKDNTPCLIHTELVSGKDVEITIMPKGFGSENMSRIAMLSPSQGKDGIIDFVIESVKKAGSKPCPPVILALGIGSTFDGCALLAKRALLRGVGNKSQDNDIRNLEEEILKRVNDIGIGVQGVGGCNYALSVNIETSPTHIAGLPVALTFGCHATRFKTKRI